MGILEVFMNRRTFLAAAGGSLTALRIHVFEPVAGAVQSRTERAPQEIARHEDFSFEIRQAFTIDAITSISIAAA